MSAAATGGSARSPTTCAAASPRSCTAKRSARFRGRAHRGCSMPSRRCLALGLALALAAGLAAASFAPRTQAAGAKMTLTLGVDQEVVGLDPNKVTAFSSFRRVDLLYNKLVTYDADLRVVGDLAESWDTPDARTYVFHLRKGVLFHDGEEMTADDVVFTIERIL